jgi:DNA-binding NarL/FixJ family response regulator
VLIVDDAPEMRLLLTMALNLQGHEVVGQAEDGDSAIAAAGKLRPDVVVLDARMPKMSGLAAMARIRQVAPAAKVILFSADPADRVEDEALAAGADAYVDKIDGFFGVLAALEKFESSE